MIKQKKAEKKLKTLSSVKGEQVDDLPREPKFLNETDAIYLWSNLSTKSETLVPPCTPQSIANLTILASPFPDNFPTFDSLNVPYVREVGVRECMNILGQYLGCTNYAYDYLQFWFLDILIDCLWKTQDEYYLEENEQKKVLEWIACIFKILTDTKACYSRKRFFKLFREMIFMAGDVLNEGYSEIPTPQKLFTIATQEESTVEKDEKEEEEKVDVEKSQTSTSTSNSTISISTYKSAEIIEMELLDQTKTFTIKRRKCWCHLDDIALDEHDLPTSLSSNSTARDTSKIQIGDETDVQDNVKHSKEKDVIDEEVTDLPSTSFQNKDFLLFYQPDTHTPKRFLPLSISSADKEEASTGLLVFSDEGGDYKEADYKKNISSKKPLNSGKKGEQSQVDEMSIKKDISNKVSKFSSMRKSKISTQSTQRRSMSDSSKLVQSKSSKLKSRENPVSKITVKMSMAELTDEQIIKKLQSYKLWEKTLEDMDDPRIGWMPVQEEVSAEATTNTDEDDWEDVQETDTPYSGKNNKHLYFNLGVLCAIIDFVFDYFYRNFHFTLIKLAAKSIPSVITQKINTEWKVPKAIKQEFHRPKPEKKKQEKKQEKKLKKDKKSSKSSNDSKKDKSKKSKKEKKDKEDSKGSKKGKDKKSQKSDKKAAHQKLAKDQKLTKEQKAALEKQRILQELLEIERRRQEENQTLLFPLTDAVTDDFFMNIFEGWKNPKEFGKQGKKDKNKKQKK